MHNLEHGYTILWYDETIADDPDTLIELEGIAKKLDVSDQQLPVQVHRRAVDVATDGERRSRRASTSPSRTGRPAATARPTGSRGIWQYCSEPSGEALEDFMKDYPYTDSPEPERRSSRTAQ